LLSDGDYTILGLALAGKRGTIGPGRGYQYSTFSGGWHALSKAKGVVARRNTPFALLRACHP